MRHQQVQLHRNGTRNPWASRHANGKVLMNQHQRTNGSVSRARMNKTVTQNLKFTARKSEVRFTPGSIPRQALTGFGFHAC